MHKYIIIFILIFITSVQPVIAQHFDASTFDNKTDFYFQIGDSDNDGSPEILHSGSPEVKGAIALGDSDPRLMIAKIINIFLGFLGMIAVLIILAGGLKVIASGGNQDAFADAKKTLSSGIIGLIIIFSAFGIARFVIGNLVGAVS